MLNPNFEIINEISTNTTTAFDAALIIFSDKNSLTSSEGFMALPFSSSFVQYLNLDHAYGEQPTLISSESAPGGRIISVYTGPLNREIDDSRIFFESAENLTKRALCAGVRKPLLILAQEPKNMEIYKRYLEVTILGIFSASYVSLCAREHHLSAKTNYNQLENFGVLVHQSLNPNAYHDFSRQVLAIEKGKRLAKDLLNSNQERMSPIKFAQHVQEAFEGVKNISIKVVSDPDTILREFPLLHAVARCSLAVKRHHPCMVEIEYLSPNQSLVEENLLFVGKGVTFDTGGADLKVNGVMRGMSRDKGGASVVAGFLKTVSELEPVNVNVRGYLSLVRNSIGADAYLCDEVIYSRAGKRVLIGNTDAEGRMAMTDVLCLAKERVISEHRSGSNIPSRLFTVATLTGHAVLAVGPYSIAMDNGPASKEKISNRIYAAGAEWADPFELSTLRREDFAMVKPGSDQEDVIQANSKPSSATCRGHQFPMAFMIVASGLDAHGSDSDSPIAYTHLDIAGSADKSPVGNGISVATGNPLASLVGAFLLK